MKGYAEKYLVRFNSRARQSPWLHFNLSNVNLEEIPPRCSSITSLGYKSSASSLCMRHGHCQHSLTRYFPSPFSIVFP